MYHIPVLLNESIQGLNIHPDGIYVDVTFGGGGHSREILAKLTTGRLYAFDQDKDTVDNALQDDRFLLIQQNFRFLKNFLRVQNVEQVDGILADLGISSHQIDDPERGFSTRFEGNLDLRMNPEQGLNAQNIINEYSEQELARVFRDFGEIQNAGKLSRFITAQRVEKPIMTTAQLKTITIRCAPRGKENQYLAQVFQALRIEVNEELEALMEMLLQAAEILKTSGRLVVISYHSLEDRIIKNLIKSGNFQGQPDKDFYGNARLTFKAMTRKPIMPSPEEVVRNPRARSARLRIAEKI
jgi:16S rRNA (cytosine1402-N4)-methyltransferase